MAERIEEKISFLGAGNIAGIWLERFLSAGILTPDRLMACDVNTEWLQKLRQHFGLQTSSDNREGARFASIVVLAPPPDALLTYRNRRCTQMHADSCQMHPCESAFIGGFIALRGRTEIQEV